MAFPTTSILDNFNRADAGPPPSANWTGPIDPGDTAGIAVVSNQCVRGAGGYGGAYWNPSVFGPDCEIFFTAQASNDFYAFARIVNPGGAGTMDGYAVDFVVNSDVVDVHRLDNAVYTKLGASISTVLNIGDQLGFSIVGSTITAYVNGVSVGTRSDATYSAAGNIGIDIGANAIFDNFGGGTITAAAGGGASKQLLLGVG